MKRQRSPEKDPPPKRARAEDEALVRMVFLNNSVCEETCTLIHMEGTKDAYSLGEILLPILLEREEVPPDTAKLTFFTRQRVDGYSTWSESSGMCCVMKADSWFLGHNELLVALQSGNCVVYVVEVNGGEKRRRIVNMILPDTISKQRLEAKLLGPRAGSMDMAIEGFPGDLPDEFSRVALDRKTITFTSNVDLVRGDEMKSFELFFSYCMKYRKLGRAVACEAEIPNEMDKNPFSRDSMYTLKLPGSLKCISSSGSDNFEESLIDVVVRPVYRVFLRKMWEWHDSKETNLLIIEGTPGTGKSVCLVYMLACTIRRATPGTFITIQYDEKFLVNATLGPDMQWNIFKSSWATMHPGSFDFRDTVKIDLTAGFVILSTSPKESRYHQAFKEAHARRLLTMPLWNDAEMQRLFEVSNVDPNLSQAEKNVLDRAFPGLYRKNAVVPRADLLGGCAREFNCSLADDWMNHIKEGITNELFQDIDMLNKHRDRIVFRNVSCYNENTFLDELTYKMTVSGIFSRVVLRAILQTKHDSPVVERYVLGMIKECLRDKKNHSIAGGLYETHVGAELLRGNYFLCRDLTRRPSKTFCPIKLWKDGQKERERFAYTERGEDLLAHDKLGCPTDPDFPAFDFVTMSTQCGVVDIPLFDQSKNPGKSAKEKYAWENRMFKQHTTDILNRMMILCHPEHRPAFSLSSNCPFSREFESLLENRQDFVGDGSTIVMYQSTVSQNGNHPCSSQGVGIVNKLKRDNATAKRAIMAYVVPEDTFADWKRRERTDRKEDKASFTGIEQVVLCCPLDPMGVFGMNSLDTKKSISAAIGTTNSHPEFM